MAQRRKQAAAAQAKAQADAARTRTLAAATAAVGTALTETENRIAALQAEIDTLTRRQDALKAEIARRDAALRPLLPLAERLSLAPATTLIASPVSPDRAVQGLAILSGLARLTAREAAEIRAQQQELATTAATLDAKRQILDSLRQSQAAQRDEDARRTRLARRVEHRAITEATQARAAVARAAAAATDLQDAIARIEHEEDAARAEIDAEARAAEAQHHRQRADRLRRQAASLDTSNGPGPTRGSSGAPVAGSIAVAWGAPMEAGPATGITYAAASSAPVHAPCAGRIDFAGEFRSFGPMLILDCGRHYRFVLAGLGALSAHSGDSVHKGAALGTMPSGGGRLFVQLRHGSEAVDPRPFL
ncbi:murein hydrolase activator EnvC family protein [Acidomonas methanolica]|uniref:Metallopeptidase membrane-bound M23 n=1 Tax=Acidomonas methanolica NBRC 104435 TaxID=1231351 RepID=A0A023D870_ACIMT|nr:peptidoglycan DD-metalloendopeptidase family protein [Acidomonas methanolica]MBU2653970.1 peptidoglycan DD-metalloendopeptidase family protein [Acidomonas methanolica]TCS30931.1 septal ring factor EnvC (AmiA/AmiB activator) [Acidomonas methanolica]GAJ29940.1 metallopeptidase membrane-bound M23 [Acidomonas methanolica NBRC 104435]GEK98271.1 hypothetical protein AME01nite_07700 [Acidomonas methanolica NBRC 104435]